MPNTNGHGPRKAILYARVSTDEQARSGYSLAQQIQALREYATREGYEVLEEVTDPGQSGASLERPGMDRVGDLVAAGGVSVVLAQDRDRFAREPAYHYLLMREFAEYGTKLKALNDRGDESAEGELTDGILDQLAKYERAKTTERTRRGRLRRAREGKIIGGHTPDYGFRYNATRDNYVVDEEAMEIVRRIFYMVGVEGQALYAVKKALERDGVSSPTGKARWSTQVIRDRVLDDVYRPHSFEEVTELVPLEVAAKLDPEKRYGIWWYNRRRTTRKQVSESGPDGRSYRSTTKTIEKERSQWIAVPVPDSGVPREWVDAAQAAIKDNKKASSAGRRHWELSGGILFCGCCGRRMVTHSVKGTKRSTRYSYYRCIKHRREGDEACVNGKSYRAEGLERSVWEFISGLLKDPERIREGPEALIKEERVGMLGDPQRQAKAWLKRLSEVNSKRSRFQDMAAEGLITFDELRSKLEEAEQTRERAQAELEALNRRREKIEELERDKDAVMESYAGMVPEELDDLTSEERHQIYKMLRLQVSVGPDMPPEVSGAFGRDLDFCELESSSRSRWIPTLTSYPAWVMRPRERWTRPWADSGCSTVAVNEAPGVSGAFLPIL